jgi:hypothetical protein
LKPLSSLLGWLGVSLTLLPIVLICLFIQIIIVIAFPVAGAILAFFVIFGILLWRDSVKRHKGTEMNGSGDQS